MLDLNCSTSELENRIYFDPTTTTCKQRKACPSYLDGGYFTYDWECFNVCVQLKNFNVDFLFKNDEETLRILKQNNTMDSTDSDEEQSEEQSEECTCEE